MWIWLLLNILQDSVVGGNICVRKIFVINN